MKIDEYWNMRCPECKAKHDLHIKTESWAAVTPTGLILPDTDDPEQNFSDTSTIECRTCEWTGMVKDAYKTQPGNDATNPQTPPGEPRSIPDKNLIPLHVALIHQNIRVGINVAWSNEDALQRLESYCLESWQNMKIPGDPSTMTRTGVIEQYFRHQSANGIEQLQRLIINMEPPPNPPPSVSEGT